jgi:hypothetical protein
VVRVMLQKCRDKDEAVRRAAYELLSQVRTCGCGKLARGVCVRMRFGPWQFTRCKRLDCTTVTQLCTVVMVMAMHLLPHCTTI